MTESNEYPSQRYLPMLEGIHDLLSELPVRSEISSIRVVAEQWTGSVSVYLATGLTLTTLTRSVIEWHHTLDTAVIAVELSTGGATLRMGLIGRTNDIHIEVWGEIPFDAAHTGLAIDPERRTFISLDQLAYWAIDDWMHRPTTNSENSDEDGDGDEGGTP